MFSKVTKTAVFGGLFFMAFSCQTQRSGSETANYGNNYGTNPVGNRLADAMNFRPLICTGPGVRLKINSLQQKVWELPPIGASSDSEPVLYKTLSWGKGSKADYNSIQAAVELYGASLVVNIKTFPGDEPNTVAGTLSYEGQEGEATLSCESDGNTLGNRPIEEDISPLKCADESRTSIIVVDGVKETVTQLPPEGAHSDSESVPLSVDEPFKQGNCTYCYTIKTSLSMEGFTVKSTIETLEDPSSGKIVALAWSDGENRPVQPNLFCEKFR